jgi:hypothetical protein
MLKLATSMKLRARDEVGVANRKLEIGKPKFFAIFSPKVFGEVAEWLKAALCSALSQFAEPTAR